MSRYWLESRSNSTLTVIDEVSDFEEITVRLRFNGLSTWTLTLRRESLYAPTFLPDVNKALNNGILLWFDPEDGITAPILLLSGPQDTYQLSRQEDGTGVLLVNGFDDNAYLQWRLALPAPMYPYAFYLRSQAAGDAVGGTNSWYTVTGNMLRLYKLNEASGTVATDLSGNASNGTYAGTIGFGQPGLVDDPATSIKMDGATTEVQVNTTSLPSGNSSFTLFGWGMLSANPSGTIYLWSIGTNVSKQNVAIGITSTGLPTIVCSGFGSQNGTIAITLNQPFLLALTYDGAGTLTGYLNGQAFGTLAVTSLTITYGFARIGDFLGTGGFWTGWLGYCGLSAAILPAATHLTMYANGVDRQAYLASDGPGSAPTVPPSAIAFTNASSALCWFVQRNCCAAALPNTPGVAQPVTAFTSFAQGYTPARAVPGLVIPIDPLLGTKTYASARFDKLLILLAALSLQSTPEIGFKTVQVSNQLQFQIFQPADKTATAVFSLDLGNLRSYTWQYGRALANYIYTGGLNAGTSLQSRTFGQAVDTTSIGQFGLIEDFYDYRKTSDTVTLASVMAAKLIELRAKRNINAAINDTNNLYFGGPGNKGYNLGDKVRVIMEDGSIYDDLVREVNISLVKSQPAKVMAAVGTPLDAQIIAEWDHIVKRFKDEGISLDLVQANY